PRHSTDRSPMMSATAVYNPAYVQDPFNPTPPKLPRFAGPDQIPDHVPSELVVEGSVLTRPEFLAAPHDFMAARHGKFPPIFYNVTPWGNTWYLTKHEDCLFVLR